jgi:hypothetical protein
VPTAAGSSTPPIARALGHVLLAGVLGVFAAVAVGPFVVASSFGGPVAVLGTLAFGTAVVTAVAVGLDRTAGPGALGRPGSPARGLVLGTLGSVALAALAWVVFAEDIGSGLPVPVRYSTAALPFAALAGLQWPGVVRIVTAIAVIGTGAAVVVPQAVDSAREDRTASIVTEVGTTAHPWVTDVDGFRGDSPQATGSELIWTPYRPANGASDAVLHLFRDTGPTLQFSGDPCDTFGWWTPEGDQPMKSCTPVGGDRWWRTSDRWQQVLERRDGEWVGVAAAIGTPEELLEEAVGNARPMTDDEYDDWLDEYFTTGPGRQSPGW